MQPTPITHGLVIDINVKHAYGPTSTPIAQGLVYDINATNAFGVSESKRTYGSVSTPIVQGLVEKMNAMDTKMVKTTFQIWPKGLRATHIMRKHAC